MSPREFEADRDLWLDGRYERKCIVESVHIERLREWVDRHPLGFRTAFPDRLVQSLYFDSCGLDDLNDNLGGVAERRKVRLRWYGESCSVRRGKLEIKCKRGTVGIKPSYPIELPAALDELRFDRLFRILVGQLPPDSRPHLESSSQAVIKASYKRAYYVSADGAVRVTIDRDLQLHDQNEYQRLNHRHATPQPDVAVLEVKYPADLDSWLRSLIGALPARQARFSKYALGGQVLLGV